MKKKISLKSSLSTLAALLYIMAALLSVLLYLSGNASVQRWFSQYQQALTSFEIKIASLERVWIVLVVIFLLYAIKCFFPIVSVSAVCVITGMVFPTFMALIINTAGLFFMMTFKYKWGVLYGGGNAHRLLCKTEIGSTLLAQNGNGNSWVLFISRLIPSFPINPVSQLYGSLHYNYKRYIIISLIGYMPKIWSYTFIGINVLDPLSANFLLPIIILLVIFGSSLFCLSSLLKYFKKV